MEKNKEEVTPMIKQEDTLGETKSLPTPHFQGVNYLVREQRFGALTP